MDKHYIMGVHITDRLSRAMDVQKALTEFGTIIKTRLGLHEVSGTDTALNGVLLLELLDREDDVNRLKDALSNIEGIEVQLMVFDHP